MRIRTIKPEFWTDEGVGAVEPLARLLFIGLWMEADPAGVVQWRAKQIAARLFPYDGLDGDRMDKLCNQLTRENLVVRYSSPEHGELVWLPNFIRHQRLNKRELDSNRTNGPTPGECGHETARARTDLAQNIRDRHETASPEGKRKGNGSGSGSGRGNAADGGGGRNGSRDVDAKWTPWIQRFWEVNPECRRVEDFAICNVLMGADPGADLEEAFEAFTRDWAGVVFPNRQSPIRELKKYLDTSAKKKRGAGGDEPAAPAKRKRLTED